MNPRTTILSHWVYPLTLVSALALHFALLANGSPLLVATYLPVLLGAGTVTLFEFVLPERPAWRPHRREVRADLCFMVAVQMILPQLFSIALVLFLASNASPGALWPHHWPVLAQAGLMLLAAELLRYWLHRAAHTWPLLWRFHAVHHAPHRLYWLNVGRFHPLEKALQLCFDSLPFVLLGVGPQVIAVYFVFYAVNGFFQHSNIRLRHGVLNYVFSTAELHRWHHSLETKEANANFGNNLILWDLVFGTFFFPRDRVVAALGVRGREHEAGFLAEMKAPFAGWSLARVPRALKQRLCTTLVKVAATANRFGPRRRLLRATRDPQRTQRKVLRDILRQNLNTAMGRDLGLVNIDDEDSFRRQVPIMDYEAHRPYLMAGTPAPLMYSRTSGTSGQPKYIPLTQSLLRQYRRQQRLYLATQYAACPQAFSGKFLVITGAACEGRLADGAVFGALSGQLYESLPAPVQHCNVLPAEVLAIEDYDLKYRVITVLALAESNITCMATANPSTFLRIRDELRAHIHQYIGYIESGVMPLPSSVPAQVAAAINARLQPDAQRAQALRIAARAGRLELRDIWPRVRLLSTWTGGSCGISLQKVLTSLPKETVVTDMGHIATEFRGTVPIDQRPGGLPLLRDHFYEFAPRADWERGEQTTRLLHELQVGEDYYIIVTTAHGLFRYFINDLVRVVGSCKQTPRLRFLRKGEGVTNLTGEKLSEDQVIAAVTRSCECRSFVLVANESAQRYDLYVEPDQACLIPAQVAKAVDRALRDLNIEFDQKRASNRLAPVKVLLLKTGFSEAYKRFHTNQGQRESQYKPKLLTYLSKLCFPLQRYLEKKHAAA